MKLNYISMCIPLAACIPQQMTAQHLKKTASQSNQDYNILVLLADDAGVGDFSCQGNRMVKTPHIDKLASQSTQFDRFYVCPFSAPTRAEFLTGRFAYRGGVVGVSEGRERLDPSAPTIAEYLQDAGYATGIFGKWHNGSQYPYHPNARGFDEFYGFCSGHWGNYWAAPLEHNGEPVNSTGYLSDDLATHAMDFISANKSKNWFCYVPFNIPHSPMMVLDSWWNPWKKRKLSQRGTLSEKEDLNHTRAALALVENLDWNVGRILDRVKELELDDNTIVVFFSDNGPNGHRFCKGFKGVKTDVDEGGVRSPLFIKMPGQDFVPAHSSQLAGAVDLMPTLLRLSGAKRSLPSFPKSDLNGMDLTRQMKDADYQVSRTLVAACAKKTSIRRDSLLLTYEGDLFNVVSDPKQTTPLVVKSHTKLEKKAKALQADLKHYQDTLATLKKTLSAPFFTVGDPREKHVKLPARDGKPHGKARRSNRFPNSSYFTNWRKPKSDSFTWQIEVLQPTTYSVYLHYRCEERLLGSKITLSTTPGGTDQALNKKIKHNKIASWTVDEAYYQPMLGADLDRVARKESYFPTFHAVRLGEYDFKKGKQTLKLVADEIKSSEVMDVYMIELRRN